MQTAGGELFARVKDERVERNSETANQKSNYHQYSVIPNILVMKLIAFVTDLEFFGNCCYQLFLSYGNDLVMKNLFFGNGFVTKLPK
jgi:hypothetical protein